MREVICIEKQKTQQPDTVLREIKYLRGMKDFVIDRRNSNRYRVLVRETVGLTAYCFSAPIYNTSSRQLVHRNFEKIHNGYAFKGSNSTVSVCENRCVLENADGRAIILLQESPTLNGVKKATPSAVTVTPTLNGLRFSARNKNIRFLLQSEAKQESIRHTPTCFTLMKEAFKPFLSVAALYAADEKGNLFPAELSYRDKGAQTYEVELSCKKSYASVLFEINLYEAKLFQDTTVESAHPDSNHAYDAVGWIGKTELFGEQWLYSRLDLSKISDLTAERVEHVFLHIPVLNQSTEGLDVFVPTSRFCSFGSTWNSKASASAKALNTTCSGRYLTLDVTSLFTNSTEHSLIYTEGLILKKPRGNAPFIAISTGDCYSAPQILEIKFSK